MSKYTFILGNNPILSIAEILRFAESENVDFNIIDIISDCLIVETKTIDIKKWQDSLGGTIKIGQIINTFKQQDELFGHLTKKNLIDNFFSQKDSKIIYGISQYGVSFNQPDKINKLAIQIKKELQDDGYSCRYIQADKKSLSSVQIDKNKIIQQGAEILLIGGIYGFYVGKTLSVQDFEDYSQRDYGRPNIDSKSGMLPPKLAKILINICQANKEKIILDPFCGSGTIIQEGLLLGYDKFIGSDISQKAVDDSQKNIDWLVNDKKIKNPDVSIIQSDVIKLEDKIKSNTIDYIITEPYLGPPNKFDNVSDIFKAIEELEDLYYAAFKSFDKICTKDATVVIIFPIIKFENDIFVLKILEKIHELNWQRINPIPENISLFARIGPTARGSLIYQRPEQRVNREIFIFQRQKN
ncbi:MAG: DNA methyltransferase [bacterium]|nr:DNA methyltransferase [bacterium]